MAVADLSKALWLRAKDLTGTAGSAVSKWADVAGDGRHGYAAGTAPVIAAAATPLGGKAVRFANNGYFKIGVAPSGTATASSNYPSEPPANAIDGRALSYFTTNGSVSGWLQIALPEARALAAYSLRRRDDIPARNITAWTFQGSNDATAWVTLDTRSGITWPTAGELKTFTFTNSSTYSYYRVNFTANAGDAYSSIAELVLGPAFAPAAAEAWVVFKFTGGGTNGLWNWNNREEDRSFTYFPYNDGAIYDPFGAKLAPNTSLAPIGTLNNTQGWRIYRVVNDGTNITAYLDNVQVGQLTVTASGGMQWGTVPRIGVTGVRTNDLNAYWSGDIAEVIVRPTVSNSTDAQDIYNYLRAEHIEAAAPTTPTVTSSLPISVPLPTSHSATLTATAALALAIALPATATTVAVTTTTSTLPITVALGSIASTVNPALTSGLPITIGLPTASTTSVTLTSALPVTVAMPISESIVGQETLTTSAALPITITLTGTARKADVLEPWDKDISQRTLLDLYAQDTVLTVLPAIADPPPTLTERPILRNSIVMDPPTVDAQGRARTNDYAVIAGVVGVPHVAIGGKDVTYFRGVPTQLGTITRAQPFGDRTFQVTFPQIGPLEQTGVGTLSWLKPGARCEVFIVTEPRGRQYRFVGRLMSQDTGNGASDSAQTWQAAGALYQGDYVGHRVPAMLDPTDIGTLIARELNGVIGRYYTPLRRVTTGIDSRQRGSLDDSALDYTQNLLSTAWLEDGSTQWTVAAYGNGGPARRYVIRPKDRTTVHWTVTSGAPGVATSLTRDLTATVNCIFGRGIAPDGYAWAGWQYPNLLADDAPAYPYSSAGTVMSIGSTDAGTSTGEGVSTWQRRAVELGHRLTVDGLFSSADAEAARDIQRDYGLLVDGIVGPQTWAATFDVGAAGGNLNAVRRPLAVVKKVEPNLYSANGALIGENPDYDRDILRIERDIDYGAGVTKAEAKRSARAELARDYKAAWTGTITLDSDPREGSRHLMWEGQNVRLLGFGGNDVLLHIVEYSEDLNSGTVTLTVDEMARDAMTLAAIQERDRESAPDPARRPGNVNRRSRQDQDIATAFDGESGAGIIPKHAIYGGLWTVIRVPVSQVGRIALVDVGTQSPAAKFCLALFGRRVTPAHLVRLVGDPLSGEDPFARTEAKAEALDDLGFIEAFGGPGQAAGYWPRDQDGGVLTGRLVDTGGVEYVSQKPPWVWVAEWSPTSTFISGRLRPAPVQ